MSDNENNVSNEPVENQQPSVEAQADHPEVIAMRNHQAKLLDELKQTQSKLSVFEEREAQIEADRLEKAKKAEDYQQLYDDAMKKLEASNNQYSQLQAQISQEKVGNVARDIAAELSNDADSAFLMAQLIQNRLKYDDGNIQVLNTNGELTVSSIDEFKKEIMNTPVYAPLLKGNHSSGGDASQAVKASTSTDPKVIPAAEYDALNPLDRAIKINEGYTRGEE